MPAGPRASTAVPADGGAAPSAAAEIAVAAGPLPLCCPCAICLCPICPWPASRPIPAAALAPPATAVPVAACAVCGPPAARAATPGVAGTSAPGSVAASPAPTAAATCSDMAPDAGPDDDARSRSPCPWRLSAAMTAAGANVAAGCETSMSASLVTEAAACPGAGAVVTCWNSAESAAPLNKGQLVPGAADAEAPTCVAGPGDCVVAVAGIPAAAGPVSAAAGGCTFPSAGSAALRRSARSRERSRKGSLGRSLAASVSTEAARS